ncbi:MAG: DUF21 domain-containing protein [Flavobacteriales bacterium]|nr:DUF21 domain-containing protein [Flavobacteriales bacterium]
MILLLGEVLPKVYATSHPMRVAQFFSTPLLGLRFFWTPVTKLLLSTTTVIEKRYKKRAKNVDAESLGHALELTTDASTTAEEQRILSGIVKFGNIEARQVMRARTEMTAFNKEISFRTCWTPSSPAVFPRARVRETADRVVGVLTSRRAAAHRSRGLRLEHIAAARLFVPENKKLDELLKEFRKAPSTWPLWWTSTAAPADNHLGGCDRGDRGRHHGRV